MTSPPVPILIAGRYQLVRQLGRQGAQGEVYEAVDTHEGDNVAIKLMTSIPRGGQWQEARILRRLGDPHILPIRNADLDAGRPYLVTDLAVHGSLDGVMSANGACGVDVGDVVRLIRHACMGVARAHDLRLLHNDIKPGNLFLNAEGECLVGDFGFASLLPPGSGVTVPAGATPETVAPEIAANPGGPNASVRSDVYSLGATAYWLIAGVPPLDLSGAPTNAAKLALVASQQPPRLWDVAPHVPRSVQSAIEMAMSRVPADRYPTTVAFAQALGGRQRVPRVWRRTDEHAPHEICWRGEPQGGGTAVLVCVEAGSKPSRVRLGATHAGSGNRIHRITREVPRSKWAVAVRSAMTKLA